MKAIAMKVSFGAFFCMFHIVSSAGVLKKIVKPFLEPFNHFIATLTNLARSDAETRGTFVDELLGTACDSTFSFLGIDDGSCICEGDVTREGNAFAMATCETEPICLRSLKGRYCGDVMLDGLFSAGTDDVEAYVNGCMTVDAGLLEGKYADLDDFLVCVSMKSSKGLRFDSCEAFVQGESCTCRVCESGVPAVTMDCSMVNISPFPDRPYYGPKVNICSLLDFSEAE